VKKCRIFLFAGTSEGREIAEVLAGDGRFLTRVYTATEYGSTLIPEAENLIHESGRLDSSQMEQEFRLHALPGAVVVDATHPYAVDVTKNIRRAAEAAGLRCIRVRRAEEFPDLPDGLWTDVADSREAAGFLSGTEGSIFLSTGSRDLEDYTSIPDYRERLYVRVLPLPEVVRKCMDLGISGRHLICMQGPFSELMNEVMFRDTGARYVVTKESGKNGGFDEKISAARNLGCRLVVLRCPEESENAVTVEECLRILKNLLRR
jgi:precorrin-6Y C5,15-methyltransferase (decarboxylating)